MLVVILIMLILLVMTVTAVNFSMDAERIRSGARQLQSFLEGARDRSIYAKEPRGVRFLIDETNPRAASSMVYVGPAERMKKGKVFLQRSGGPGTSITRVAWKADESIPGGGYVVSEWYLLKQKGLLTDGARIRIPDDGMWYTVDIRPLNHPDPRGPDGKPGVAGIDDDQDGATDEDDELGWPGSDDPVLRLTTPFLQSEIVQPAGLTYELELPPVVLPNQEPTLLARNIVVDLDRSRIPSIWRISGGYTSHMDILFSPRGTVIGPAAAMGTIHFVLREQVDAEFGLPLTAFSWSPGTQYVVGSWVAPSTANANGFFYKCKTAGLSGSAEPNWPTDTGTTVNDGSIVWEAYQKHDSLIVSLQTQTGNVGSYPVYEDDPGDPFRYAETGEVASQ